MPNIDNMEGSLRERSNVFPRTNARKAYAQGAEVKDHNYSIMIWTGMENVNVNPQTLQWLYDMYADRPTQTYNQIDLGYKQFTLDARTFDYFKERLTAAFENTEMLHPEGAGSLPRDYTSYEAEEPEEEEEEETTEE